MFLYTRRVRSYFIRSRIIYKIVELPGVIGLRWDVDAESVRKAAAFRPP